MGKKEWLEGFKKIYPVMISYVPLGLACGMLLYDAGVGVVGIFLMSMLVFAGAGQFMAASMLSAGATMPSIIIMTFFLNLRHLLMSSSIAPFFKKRSVPFLMLFSHTLADEAYAINYNQFQTDKEWKPEEALTTNLLAYSSWVGSTVVGGYIGSSFSMNPVIMNYVLIAMFTCMLVNQFVSKIFVIVGLLSGVLAVILMMVLQHNISLVIAAVLASFVGYLLDEEREKKRDREGDAIQDEQ